MSSTYWGMKRAQMIEELTAECDAARGEIKQLREEATVAGQLRTLRRLEGDVDAARAQSAEMELYAVAMERERDAALTRVAELEDALRVIRSRHTRDARMGYDDVRCMSCPDEAWPCPTAAALDAVPAAETGDET